MHGYYVVLLASARLQQTTHCWQHLSVCMRSPSHSCMNAQVPQAVLGNGCMSFSSGVFAAVACSLGLWSYSGPAAPPAVPIVAAECSCHCDHTCAVSGEAGADRAVLDLLKSQLDRCGPDQLKAQPCVCPPQAPCPPILQRGALELLGVGFCFGLLVGASVAWPLRARV